jgi:hypothetical protein
LRLQISRYAAERRERSCRGPEQQRQSTTPAVRPRRGALGGAGFVSSDREVRSADLFAEDPTWTLSGGKGAVVLGPCLRVQSPVDGSCGDVGETPVVVPGVAPQPREGFGQVNTGAF